MMVNSRSRMQTTKVDNEQDSASWKVLGTQPPPFCWNFFPGALPINSSGASGKSHRGSEHVRPESPGGIRSDIDRPQDSINGTRIWSSQAHISQFQPARSEIILKPA